MAKIITSPWYVIGVTALFGGFGGGGIILKIRKNEVFLTYEGEIGS